eukprot:962794-Pyramimonas_sp.AAC.1
MQLSPCAPSPGDPCQTGAAVVEPARHPHRIRHTMQVLIPIIFSWCYKICRNAENMLASCVEASGSTASGGR